MPQRTSLDALSREQLKLAARASGGRTAHTVYCGHEKVLRQKLIATVAGLSCPSTRTRARRRCWSYMAGYGCHRVSWRGRAAAEI